MSLERRDVRRHIYRCDVCGKTEREHFPQDVDDHLPGHWVAVSRDPADNWKQNDDDLLLCPVHAHAEGLVKLMVRLGTEAETRPAEQIIE